MRKAPLGDGAFARYLLWKRCLGGGLPGQQDGMLRVVPGLVTASKMIVTHI